MAAMTSHVPWKPTTPNREGVSTPPKNDPSDIHKAQMPVTNPTRVGAE